MKLVTLLGIFALWCGMLGAQIFYPVEQGLWENLDFCLFGGDGLYDQLLHWENLDKPISCAAPISLHRTLRLHLCLCKLRRR